MSLIDAYFTYLSQISKIEVHWCWRLASMFENTLKHFVFGLWLSLLFFDISWLDYQDAGWTEPVISVGRRPLHLRMDLWLSWAATLRVMNLGSSCLKLRRWTLSRRFTVVTVQCFLKHQLGGPGLEFRKGQHTCVLFSLFCWLHYDSHNSAGEQSAAQQSSPGPRYIRKSWKVQ